MSIFVLIRGVFIAVLMMVMSVGYASAQNDEPLIPIIDWQERQTNLERLTAFGDDLMGDAIDPNIGSLVFAHTDVSLPGNSGLEVAIRRQLTQGYKYDEGINVEFGDWELVVPKITAIAMESLGWAGRRCSGTWDENFPEIQRRTTTLTRNGYMNGVNVTIPGQGSQTMLRTLTNGQFPVGTKANTASEWYFTCTNATDGKEGFIGHAPNGHKYHFTKLYPVPIKN